MKKTIILTLILIACVSFSVYGQSSPIDLVLLLDTSSGMSSSYEYVSDYLIGAFLSEYMRTGDTFHLIAFSENQKLDFARRINGIGDVEAIITRMLLQYPVETGTDIEGVLGYAERYITALPDRPKKIVLISTGDSNTNNLVSASRQNLGSTNATLDYIQVRPGQPLTNLPSSGRPPAVSTSASVQASAPVVAAPTVTTPAVTAPVQTPVTSPVITETPNIVAVDPVVTEPVIQPLPVNPEIADSGFQGIEDSSEPPAGFETDISQINQTEQETTTPQQEQTQTVQSETPQQQTQQQTQQPAQQTQQTPAQTTRPQTASSSAPREGSSINIARLLFILLGLLILALIIFFIIRSRNSRYNNSSRAQPAAAVPSPKEKFVDHSKDLAKYASGQSRRTTPYDDRPAAVDKSKPVEINPTGPLILNLFVEDQCTSIGKRNIHSLKSGYKLSVGGGKSDDFFIFLVPMPGNIGEIRRNGSQLTFIPRKSRYFPDIGSEEVRDCINKTIRIVSDKNYEMRFRFEMYEDPLIALNRMLKSVNVPG